MKLGHLLNWLSNTPGSWPPVVTRYEHLIVVEKEQERWNSWEWHLDLEKVAMVSQRTEDPETIRCAAYRPSTWFGQVICKAWHTEPRTQTLTFIFNDAEMELKWMASGRNVGNSRMTHSTDIHAVESYRQTHFCHCKLNKENLASNPTFSKLTVQRPPYESVTHLGIILFYVFIFVFF